MPSSIFIHSFKFSSLSFFHTIFLHFFSFFTILLILNRFQEISSFLTIYGVNEFLSNLGGGTDSKTLIDNMNRKNSHTTSNQVSPDTKSFYEYVTDKKSSFLNPFTSSTKPPRSSSNGSNGSIMSAAEHNDFMFKSNGNYTVNSIGASEIGEINENRSNGINSSGTNSQHSITSNSPKMTRGSSSKVYNLLGMEPFILFSYLYDYNYFFINLFYLFYFLSVFL